MKDCVNCTENGKRERNGFFQELLAESSTRGYENVPPMALFTPTEG